MHCSHTLHSLKLISPSYHLKCQLTAFTKSFQFIVLWRLSLPFEELNSGFSHVESIHSSDRYLDSRLLYPEISQHAAQTVLKPVDVDT